MAHQLATGVADTHNYPKEGVAAIAHTDISTGQFVHVTKYGLYKLHDFNRCRFIQWNKIENKACPYFVNNNPGPVCLLFSDSHAHAPGVVWMTLLNFCVISHNTMICFACHWFFGFMAIALFVWGGGLRLVSITRRI